MALPAIGAVAGRLAANVGRIGLTALRFQSSAASFGVRIDGAKAVAERFQTATDRLAAELKKRGFRTLGERLEQGSEGAIGGRLSGPDGKRDDGGRTLGTFSGDLKGAISYDVLGRHLSRLRVEVGPTGSPGTYGRIHELGLGAWPERPFLAVGLQKNEQEAEKLVGRSLRFV